MAEMKKIEKGVKELIRVGERDRDGGGDKEGGREDGEQE